MSSRLSPALSPSASTRSIERVPSPTPSQQNKDVEKGDDDAAKGGEVTIGPPLTPGVARHGEELQRQMSSRHSECDLESGPLSATLTLTSPDLLAVAMVRREESDRLASSLFLTLPLSPSQISLGGAIGTGLYLGIANALATGGPVSTLAHRSHSHPVPVPRMLTALSCSWVSSSVTPSWEPSSSRQ